MLRLSEGKIAWLLNDRDYLNFPVQTWFIQLNVGIISVKMRLLINILSTAELLEMQLWASASVCEI